MFATVDTATEGKLEEKSEEDEKKIGTNICDSGDKTFHFGCGFAQRQQSWEAGIQVILLKAYNFVIKQSLDRRHILSVRSSD